MYGLVRGTGLRFLCLLVVCLAARPSPAAKDGSPATEARTTEGKLPLAEGGTGEQIYRKLCASCHGARGEGDNENYPQPLAGDRSLAELVQYIDKSMPDESPERCVGEDARKVAAYIYDAFYSPIAQARIKPPRIELARLTVRQYRHAIADLIGSFRSGGVPTAGQWNEQRGLRGEYFKSRRFRNEERVIERVDPVVKFDFGESSPDPEKKIEPQEFAIRWQGSVLAPDTGDYEFVIQSETGARLWVNDLERPLIDAAVKSGKDVERRESMHLLGGRVYPLRLEVFKSKEAKEKRAAITLKWKPPLRAAEVIPERCLSPQRFPETFVVATPFPPDDRSMGYERGTSISKEWEQATTDAALEVAAYVAAHLRELSGVRDDAPDRPQALREFGVRFAERAFRRPLSEELKQLFVDRQFAEAAAPVPASGTTGAADAAVKRVVLLVLKSPRFLFRELGSDGQDAYDVAARLAFGLWDSLPDEALHKAAASGQLVSPEQIRHEAQRMLPDLRTRAKLREFFMQWLRVDQLADVSKDPQRFPEFSPAVASELRTSLDLFLDDVLGSEGADFRQLLLSDSLYLNGTLAKLYGVDLPADAAFQKVTLPPGERAGVLTHPYLLAGFACTATSSPIHRGVFVSRSLLGRVLRPPPEAVAPLAPELHAELTTRERVVLQTGAESCQSCHAMINPLGFTLENFDAIGRFRLEEQGKPVDATGAYLARSGEQKSFAGARDLATFLAEGEETHAAFVQQLFHYLVKQPIRAYGLDTPDRLRQSFVQNQFNIRQLMLEIVTATAMANRL